MNGHSKYARAGATCFLFQKRQEFDVLANTKLERNGELNC